MKKGGILMVLGSVLCLAGCGGRARVEGTMPICLESVPMGVLFASAERVLTEMQFEIDKSDPEAGRILTRPLRGGQFFEFWRQDNATVSAAAEANLHSIQRIVEIRFEQAGDQACANCRVLVRRLSMPEQPFQGRGGAAGMFTESGRTRQSLQIREEAAGQAEWIELGRDSALEQVILKKIEKAALIGGKP